MLDPAIDFPAGVKAIEDYLNAVEKVLVDAQAPRSDRMQVIQDLESQIADMLAQQSQPLTEEKFAVMIASLESPSHFAENYVPRFSLEKAHAIRRASLMQQYAWLNPWLKTAALACVCLLIATAVALSLGLSGVHGAPMGIVVLLVSIVDLAAMVALPIALFKGIKALQQSPQPGVGRSFAITASVLYVTVVPVVLFVFLTLATRGYFLYVVAVGLSVVSLYRLVTRFRAVLSDSIPPDRVAVIDDEHQSKQVAARELFRKAFSFGTA